MIKQATQTRKSQQAKELTIVAIYKFKTNGKLNGTRCTLIRSTKVVKGETIITEHKVWTHANGCAPHCDCDGFEKTHGKRQCCHIKLVTAPVVEQPQALVQPIVKTSAPKETAKVAVVASPAKRQPDLDAESKRRTSAPLNGNQGFSMLKKAS